MGRVSQCRAYPPHFRFRGGVMGELIPINSGLRRVYPILSGVGSSQNINYNYGISRYCADCYMGCAPNGTWPDSIGWWSVISDFAGKASSIYFQYSDDRAAATKVTWTLRVDRLFPEWE